MATYLPILWKFLYHLNKKFIFIFMHKHYLIVLIFSFYSEEFSMYEDYASCDKVEIGISKKYGME